MFLKDLNKEQLKKFYEWNNDHIQKCPHYENPGAIGGRLTYCFTPTGLGTIVKIVCSCGEELDLTDYDKW